MTDVESQLADFVRPAYDGKFQSKLGFSERCTILALILHGVDQALVAAAYGINRRTITHMKNNHSPHYKPVREEYQKLGLVDFKKQYLTEDAVQKLKAVQDDPQRKAAAKQTAVDHRNDPASSTPSARRDKKRGIHIVKEEEHTYSHRVDIKWFDEGGVAEDSPAGWYSRDMEHDGEPYTNYGPESLISSNSALEAAKVNIYE